MKKKEDKKEMPFLDHLEELRWRIIKSFSSLILLTIGSFPLTTWILTLLTYPNAHLAHPAKLVYLKPTAMMMIRMELSISMGLIGSLPVILYQLWRFVAPGLLPKEKYYIFPVIFITIVCFSIGALFAYFVIIPVMLPFLFSMGTQFIEANINISDYMSFVLRLILISGLVFEMPVLAFFLARIGLVSHRTLIRFWRYALVIIFIFCAIVTPTPDPFNQIILAIPLMLLYGISIWVAALAHRKRKRSEAASDVKKPSAKSRKKPKRPVKKAKKR